MTCVVAVKKYGKVVMGADSQGTYGFHKMELLEKKIWKSNGWILGFAGTTAELQHLVERSIDRPSDEMHAERTLREWMLSARSTGLFTAPFDLLVGYKDRLWHTGSSCAIRECDLYGAIGSGAHFAIGAIEQSRDERWDALGYVESALRVAARVAEGVDYPFYAVDTENPGWLMLTRESVGWLA